MKPVILISAIITGIILLSSFNQDPQLKESIERGKEVYTLNCQNCHMEDGMGMQDVNPPLAKSDYLKKPGKTLIGIVLKGQSGEIIVNGKKYNGNMPSMISIATGPSRTADIEKTLVLGAHGPKEVYVFFIDQPSV